MRSWPFYWLYWSKPKLGFYYLLRRLMTLFNISKNINNRSVYLPLINHSSCSKSRREQRPPEADKEQRTLGLTTENGRWSRNLASLMASLWAWNIFTLFMLDCQYLTKPPWSAVSIHMSLWDQVMARTGLSWAYGGQKKQAGQKWTTMRCQRPGQTKDHKRPIKLQQ